MTDFAKLAVIERRHQAASVSALIHPDDPQQHLAGNYVRTGAEAIKVVLNAMSLMPAVRHDRILDIPCGFGLVSRHLRSAFPDAEIFHCDENELAAEFCAAEFGGSPIYSQPDGTVLPKKLDIIWASSTPLEGLTHVARHLSAGGVMIAAVPPKKPPSETIESIKKLPVEFLAYSEMAWNGSDIVILRRA